ncbi:MAG: phosphoribosylglycinamide formyltransferase [Phycisphaera sp.]|nr:phosphoribosylglycinamide formyltransferase [Phycisphaera sp.]
MTNQSNPTPIRVAALISGGGRTMLNIAECIDDGDLDAEIALVISSRPDAAGVSRALDLDLSVCVIDRKEYADVDTFSAAVWDRIRNTGVDLVVMAGFLCFLKIPDDFAGRVMNIHPALLPKFGGQGMYGHHVHEAVIAAGEKESGCTVHFVDNIYDHGPIILQRRCPVLPDDTPDSLAARVFEQELIAYPEAIRMYQDDAISE